MRKKTFLQVYICTFVNGQRQILPIFGNKLYYCMGHWTGALKDVFYSLLSLIDFFYNYIHCINLNAELNKLIITEDHCARVFPQNDLEYTHLCKEFRLYLCTFLVLLIKSLSCNNTLNKLGMYVSCIYNLSLYQQFTQNVLNWLMNNIIDCFVVWVFVISSQIFVISSQIY